MARAPEAWLSVPKPSLAPRVKLFCFPYAGGSAAVYRPWADVLPPDIEVNAIQLPGREWRLKEPPIDSLEVLLSELMVVLAPSMDIPFAFFGHSLGALVSFELARTLRRERHIEPVHLFVSAYRAPQLPNDEPQMHDAIEEDVVTALRSMRGTPDDVLGNRDLMELLLPALRADFAIADRYEYVDEPPLSAPISVFGGLGDADFERRQLEPWAAQTTGAFKLRMMPGSHFFINEAADLLLRALFNDLMVVEAT